MKKLVVLEDETNSPYASLISEFLSMQYNYGLYDFNVDKILNDINQQYDIKLKFTRMPYYELEDKNGGIITLMFMEQYTS